MSFMAPGGMLVALLLLEIPRQRRSKLLEGFMQKKSDSAIVSLCEMLANLESRDSIKIQFVVSVAIIYSPFPTCSLQRLMHPA